MQTCTKCKKEFHENDFKKNGKILKTCITCRTKKVKWVVKHKQDLNRCKVENKTWSEIKDENKKIHVNHNKIPHCHINNKECKHCGKCKKFKPLSNFGYHAQSWDKLRNTCKVCLGVYRESIQDKLNEIVNCDLCNKKLKFRSLYDHNRNIHSDNTYKWKCNDCHITFKHKKLLNNHLKTDSHKKVIAFKTLNKDEMNDKIEEMREECENFSYYKLEKDCKNCPICQKQFSQTNLVQRHIDNVHNQIKCKLCYKMVSIANYKSRHIDLCVLNHMINKYPGVSKWERLVSKYFIDNNINFEMQKKYCDFKNVNCLPYDFYLPDQEILVEVHGLFHYILSSYKNAEEILKRNKQVDKLKIQYAKSKGMLLLIIDTRKFDSYDKISKFLTRKLKMYE